VPAYIIFSDVALREMASKYPTTELEFGRISGVGKLKLREFAPIFLAEIVDHLRNSPRKMFADSFTVPPFQLSPVAGK
jgi:ATP-dependent DNA helicase RecQ